MICSNLSCTVRVKILRPPLYAPTTPPPSLELCPLSLKCPCSLPLGDTLANRFTKKTSSGQNRSYAEYDRPRQSIRPYSGHTCTSSTTWHSSLEPHRTAPHRTLSTNGRGNHQDHIGTLLIVRGVQPSAEIANTTLGHISSHDE